MILRKILFITLLTWFCLSVIGYGFYKAMPIFLGPKIEIVAPINGDIISSTSVEVRGNVTRTKALYINNVPTAFTETGTFATRLPIYSGSNLFIFSVEDKFGRVVTETITVGTK